MRVFAGPNGSGKSTIFNQIANTYDLGIYINPDEIERDLISEGYLDLSPFEINNLEDDEFANFLEAHSIVRKAKEKGFSIKLLYDRSLNAIINTNENRPSYEAALIADFLRIKLILQGKKLSFESVMSDHSKLEIFELARNNGYRIYLYYICTESPEINKERVKLRVLEGGHGVDEAKIESRYYNTLKYLKEAVQKTFRSFLWDNSGREPDLILEVEDGTTITMHSANPTPHWCEEYLLRGTKPETD